MAKIALVTGGAGGIGQAVSLELAQSGFDVFATYTLNNALKAQTWQYQVAQQGHSIELVCADVTSFDSCKKAVAEVLARAGSIDVLVNNAGITRDISFRKMTLDDWNSVISTNLSSVFHMSKCVIEGMIAKSWGRVINISSVNAQKGAFGQTNYSAAKAGMHGFTKALSLEMARYGITVNTISPGYVETPMTAVIPEDIMTARVLPQIPLGRLGKPEEIAGMVAYLCSDKAAYITGADISINGGLHMS